MRMLLTTRQAAEYIGIKVRTLRQWVRDGKIKVVRLENDNRLYFDASDVERAKKDRFSSSNGV